MSKGYITTCKDVKKLLHTGFVTLQIIFPLILFVIVIYEKLKNLSYCIV